MGFLILSNQMMIKLENMSAAESRLTPLKFRRRVLTSMRSAGESRLSLLKLKHQMLKTSILQERRLIPGRI
jgi:hypothetical protein